MGVSTVREERDRYLARNGLSLDGYSAKTFSIRPLGIPVRLPNTKGRRQVVPFHDLHHVATGYGTDFAGEGEIAIWELRAGCRSLAAYFLNAGAAAIGLLVAPRRMLRAFRRARGARSLYRLDVPYELLLRLPVTELRELVRVTATA